jgi:hypothetical protein
MRELKFDLNDIVLIPAEESQISSRNECDTNSVFNILNGLQFNSLPLMASPMDTVVSKENYTNYIKNNIIPCIPRGQQISDVLNDYFMFHSYGLCEIETILNQIEECEKTDGIIPFRLACSNIFSENNVLIDIANGHMSKLVDIIKKIKKYFPEINLMIGNVANPETFINIGLAGADFVRISIGTGCFIPGQMLKTDNAEKNIEEIEIGNKVLTHTGEFKEVINKFQYEIDEEILEINDIKCTQNHEFFVIEKIYEDIVNDENLLQYAKWISAKDLNINKHLLIQY